MISIHIAPFTKEKVLDKITKAIKCVSEGAVVGVL